MLNYFLEYNRYLNILGILLIFVIAYILSSNRKKICLRLVLTTLTTQFILAYFTLKTLLGSKIVFYVAKGVSALYKFAGEGAKFLFGPLADSYRPGGMILAFSVLPVIVFFGALISILLYFRIIQAATKPISSIIYRIFGTSAAESLCAVGNSFLGQTEAPLLIKDYLNKLTRSELFTVMLVGMGTTSAPLFIVYASMGAPLKFILSATVMAIPATILISKILLPETESPETQTGLVKKSTKSQEEVPKNVFEVVSDGTWSGLQIALAVGATLVAFIGIIALFNNLLMEVSVYTTKLLNLTGLKVVLPKITFQSIVGTIFIPFGWLMGLSGQEIFKAGQLLGTKFAVNEVIAYSTIRYMELSERGLALLTVALCGFANFSSIGIQIAGIGTLAPKQKTNIAKLGLKALIGATLANLLSAFVAGLIL